MSFFKKRNAQYSIIFFKSAVLCQFLNKFCGLESLTKEIFTRREKIRIKTQLKNFYQNKVPMTQNMSSTSTDKLDTQNVVIAKHVILYKCNALFTKGINSILANLGHYSTTKCDSPENLEDQVLQKGNIMVVVQLNASGKLDLQLKEFIAQHNQLKFLLVFQENCIPVDYEFLHRDGVELYFMKSSHSKLISAIESLEKKFYSSQKISPSVYELSAPSKEKVEDPIINPFDKLTQIQSKVAQQLCQGIKQLIIAENMGIAPSNITVYKKLKISSVAELAVLNNKQNVFYQE